MKDRGSTCKFRNAQSAFPNLYVDPVFDNTMRNKQVEFNPYIYTFFKLSCIGYEISILIHNRAVFRTATGAAGSYVTATVPWKNGSQNFSHVHSSRKHWKCKYLTIKACLRWYVFLDILVKNAFLQETKKTCTSFQCFFKMLNFVLLIESIHKKWKLPHWLSTLPSWPWYFSLICILKEYTQCLSE